MQCLFNVTELDKNHVRQSVTESKNEQNEVPTDVTSKDHIQSRVVHHQPFRSPFKVTHVVVCLK